MKQLTLKIPDEAHRAFKMMAAARGKTMTQLLLEWVESAKLSIIEPEEDLVLQAFLRAPKDTVEPFTAQQKSELGLAREESTKPWEEVKAELEKLL